MQKTIIPTHVELTGYYKMIKILYLSLNPDLRGPLPKIEPVLTSALRNLGCQITRSTWGRHFESESLGQKITGRLNDIKNVILKLANWRPDILFVATTLDESALLRDVPLLLVTWLFPVKKVMMMHGSKSETLISSGHHLFKFMTEILIRCSDAILLLSDDEMREWAQFAPLGNYYRVENPFIPAHKNGSKSDTGASDQKTDLNLLFVGRLDKDKGIYELLDAMSVLIKQVKCHLLVAGDGEEKNEMIRRIENTGLKESVSLLGYINADQLDEVYKSASIFILPSYREGFPAVITEAMSYGLPIITTPIRGICDHLPDDVNALYVHPRDSKAIADAALQLLGNPDWCLRMGQANLAKIQEFKPEKVAPKYIEIFTELLKSDKRSIK